MAQEIRSQGEIMQELCSTILNSLDRGRIIECMNAIGVEASRIVVCNTPWPLHQKMDLLHQQGRLPPDIKERLNIVVHDIFNFIGKDMLSATDYLGNTLLHGAVSLNNLELVRFLVESGCPIDFDEGGSRAPLQIAAHAGDQETFEYLIRRGSTFFFHINAIPQAKRKEYQNLRSHRFSLYSTAVNIHHHLNVAFDIVLQKIFEKHTGVIQKHTPVMTAPVDNSKNEEKTIRFRLESRYVHRKHCRVRHMLVILGMFYNETRKRFKPISSPIRLSSGFLNGNALNKTTPPGREKGSGYENLCFNVRPSSNREEHTICINQSPSKLQHTFIAVQLVQYTTEDRLNSCRGRCVVERNGGDLSRARDY